MMKRRQNSTKPIQPEIFTANTDDILIVAVIAVFTGYSDIDAVQIYNDNEAIMVM